VQIRPTEAQRADLATRHETFRNFPAPLQEQPVGQPKKRSAEEAGVASGPASPKRPKVSELLSVQLREVGTSEKELEDQDRKIDTVDREIEVMARELEIKKREIEAMAKDLAMKQRELEVMKREQASAKDGVRWKRQAIESQIREEALKERLHQEGSRQTQKDPYPRRF
jgi:chromosome segregation ATPase